MCGDPFNNRSKTFIYHALKKANSCFQVEVGVK